MGSISKPVAAFAALQLAQRGQFDIDKPVADYLSAEYLPSETPDKYVSALTFRTVLNHTSGLPNDVTGEDRELRHEPGTEFAYSGGGFQYAQAALEEITGEGVDKTIEEFVFEQLCVAVSGHGPRACRSEYAKYSS